MTTTVGYGEEADEVENCAVPYYNVEGFIFCFEMASGSKGQIPHFAKPDLMLGIENDFSKGDFNTLENSLFIIAKFFLENDKARTAFEKLSFSDLKTATSRDWRALVLCGGKQNNTRAHSLYFWSFQKQNREGRGGGG